MPKSLSKSRYTAFCQCPKNLWLKVYQPEEAKDYELPHVAFIGSECSEMCPLIFGLLFC